MGNYTRINRDRGHGHNVRIQTYECKNKQIKEYESGKNKELKSDNNKV